MKKTNNTETTSYDGGSYIRNKDKIFINAATVNPVFPAGIEADGEVSISSSYVDPSRSIYTFKVKGWSSWVDIEASEKPEFCTMDFKDSHEPYKGKWEYKAPTGGTYTFQLPADGTYTLEGIQSVTLKNGKVTVTFKV